LEIIKLKTRTRTGTGKSYTRKTRANGWVPAIYYGKTTDPVCIEVDEHEFAAIVRKRHLTHLIDLGLGKTQEESIAVIKDVQRHVIKDSFFYHIDFQHVALTEKVTVHCPVEIVGTSVGVKDENGVLGNPVKSLTIECLPMNIPDKITIDVTGLHVGNSIHVRDLMVPDISIKDAPEEVIAVVTHAAREVADTPAAEGEGSAAAEASPK
jgi:large subunit ribosomal protein L25